MSIDKETLFNLVQQEAANLRKNATQEELNELDFQELDPDHPARCIYGQMTKHCYGERAGELIISCAEKVYRADNINVNMMTNPKLNGKPKPVIYRKGKYYSPIEVLIDKYPDNNSRLIDYLKGVTDELELS